MVQLNKAELRSAVNLKCGRICYEQQISRVDTAYGVEFMEHIWTGH